MFLIKIYIKESYINYYHTIIQMCGQYCILAPSLKPKFASFHVQYCGVLVACLSQMQNGNGYQKHLKKKVKYYSV